MPEAPPPHAGTPESGPLAAAALANSVASLMEQLVEGANALHQDIAAAMGVTPGRLSQLIGSDGNVRIASLGRLAEACEADLRLTAVARSAEDVITVPRSSSRRRAAGARPGRGHGTDAGSDRAPVEPVETCEPDAHVRTSMAAAALSNSVGSLLEQVADGSSLTRSVIAERMGVTPGRITQILDGDGNVRIATLARLLEATGYDVTLTGTLRGTGVEITAPRVSNRRRRCLASVGDTCGSGSASADDAERPARPTEAERKTQLRRIVPLRELVKRADVPAGPLEAQEQAVCALLEIATPWDEVPFAAAARRHNSGEPVNMKQRTWLACARKAARATTVAPYDPDGVRALAEGLARRLQSPNDFAELPAMFAGVGVRLVRVAPFPSSKISGAAFLLDDQPGCPVIAISGRGKRLDKVLFTLLHEMAHVVLGHLQPAMFFIDEDETSTEPQETAADEVAAAWALPSGIADPPARVAETWVRAEAQRHGVHPAMIVGRLQHSEHISWSAFTNLTPNVDIHLEGWHRA